MNKNELLFQMMEQPQLYTAEEWQEILADDECRELYTLMSKTQSAIDAARAHEHAHGDEEGHGHQAEGPHALHHLHRQHAQVLAHADQAQHCGNSNGISDGETQENHQQETAQQYDGG